MDINVFHHLTVDRSSLNIIIIKLGMLIQYRISLINYHDGAEENRAPLARFTSCGKLHQSQSTAEEQQGRLTDRCVSVQYSVGSRAGNVGLYTYALYL